MGFFNNAIDFISNKSNSKKKYIDLNVPSNDICSDADFSIRNYAKESFSVLIYTPLSKCMLKIMKGISFLITGGISGIIVAAVCFLIFSQFSGMENTIISSLIFRSVAKIMPEADLSMKSAIIRWNPDIKTMEILIDKVRLDDMSIQKLIILPDFAKTFKQEKLVAKSVSIINPKLYLNASDDFRITSFCPNMEKWEKDTSLIEPISSVDTLQNVFGDDVTIKLVNAEIRISENGVLWNLKDVYAEYKIGDTFPKLVDGKIQIPGQDYMSRVAIDKIIKGNQSIFNIKMNSLNPSILCNALYKRNLPIDHRIQNAIDGYNVPVSGDLKLTFANDELVDGIFDLNAASGSIKLPSKNSLALNLGKRIDSGSIFGSFSASELKINVLNIVYGDASIQLTGINVPLANYNLLDIANIDGTLTLHNIDTKEMETMLPENMCKLACKTFNDHLLGFKIESFKVDLKGPASFGDRVEKDDFIMGKCVFKINDAKIPIGDTVVTNVKAIGTVAKDGIDIKLMQAKFKDTQINSGAFYLSNRDKSWIGKINADIFLTDIQEYTKNISEKLSLIPFNKLNLNATANMDLKLVRIVGDTDLKGNHPFKIVAGNGIIRSGNNAKELKLSWNEKGLNAVGDINTGENKISIKMSEDFNKHSGVSVLSVNSNSDFMEPLIPGIKNICLGDLKLKINSFWNSKNEEHDVNLNLKNSSFSIPIIGKVKKKQEDGVFSTKVTQKNNVFEFSQMLLETPSCKVKGKMAFDKNGILLHCALDNFENNGSSAKINLLRENEKLLFSAVGDSLNATNVWSILNKIDKNLLISTYVNLKEIQLGNNKKIKNAKGTIDFKNSKVVGGSCYCVMGSDTTVALNVKDIENSDDCAISISASNAGDFLKYMSISNAIQGGCINFVGKTSKHADQSLSGAFEIKDFIVNNSTQLIKLISLSSTNWLPSTDKLSVGFNFCTGNFIIADNDIKMEGGKMIGPSMAISFSGTYDRKNDNLDIMGTSLPIHALMNSKSANGALAAYYAISGPIEDTILSVKPLKFIDNDILNANFGNMLPMMIAAETDYKKISPIQSPNHVKDPFENKAFDHVSVEDEKSTEEAFKQTRDKYGIKITRGLKTNAR